jgi:hypothetical protein
MSLYKKMGGGLLDDETNSDRIRDAALLEPKCKQRLLGCEDLPFAEGFSSFGLRPRSSISHCH